MEKPDSGNLCYTFFEMKGSSNEYTTEFEHETGERAINPKHMNTNSKVFLLLAITTLLLSCNLPSAETTLPNTPAAPHPVATVITVTTAPLSITIPPPPPGELSSVTPTIVPSTGVTALTDIVSYDDLAEMLKIVNRARCGQGLSPLTGNRLLSNAAAQHNLDMLLNNYFDHNGSDDSTVGDRASVQGYTWQAVGENLAAGSTSAAETFDLWWQSPGHKANMLNADFREAGLSHLFKAGSQWGHYWTMVFANRGTTPPTCVEMGY